MSQSPDSNTVTNGIRVTASARYLPEESDPDSPFHLYMYRIAITNESRRRVKLRSRHWIIRDAYNEREDVRGPGVVGEYPVLDFGQSYEYTSQCPLTTTRWGTMEGSYTFEDVSTGQAFDVAIGRFFLVPTRQLEPIEESADG
jgi:ApaG protein